MELACNAVVPGLDCEFVAKGESVDEVHAAMMAHGSEVHSDLMQGLSPEEQQKKGQEMDAHIRELIGAGT